MPTRSELRADPAGVFVHDLVLQACTRFADRSLLVDTSYIEPRRVSYGEYGALVERAARGLVAAGLRPRERVAIYLLNSWEYCVSYHAATFAGGIPTPLNPSYREREVRYQLDNSGAVILITDGPLIAGMNLAGLPDLRRIYTTRDQAATGAEPFANLLRLHEVALPHAEQPSHEAMAVLPYSSGTTGLPKGVMLTHHNLVANIYQLLGPGCSCLADGDVTLCFLPLYHIYGLNVVLNPSFTLGATLVLMPRFDATRAMQLTREHGVTFIPAVPPVLNAFCQAAEQGLFPRDHRLRWVKCGAAPLAADLGRRFISLTGVPVVQGYGMTEASPVTHVGLVENVMEVVGSIGLPVAQTECRLIAENGAECAEGEPGELVMRGPQFMRGYWRAPEASAEVLRPLPHGAAASGEPVRSDNTWYWSGDVARRDERGLYYIVDRRKEMIKYKSFSVAPAEVESVLLEHPAVRDCGVVGRADPVAGEVPCAFVVLREGFTANTHVETDIRGYVSERLTAYKQPREVHFVDTIPRNPSGKILRRKLREAFE
jgi:long-chain acyl-CoA synthetase